MPRDFEALYRAQTESKAAANTNLTVSLPPGYLVGFDVRLRQDYTVLITAGACNIGGRLVQVAEDHQLADADWIAPKINSARHYYIYLSKAGEWFVDIVAPVWNNQYLYYEQPDTNWRAVGKIFLADGHIIFGIKEVEKNEQTVTMAPAGFTGKADYYCTGDNDQILINAAIRYLHEAYDGGVVNILQGEYYCSASLRTTRFGLPYYGIAINLFDYSNVQMVGSGISTKIHLNNVTATYNILIGRVDATTSVISNNAIKNIYLDTICDGNTSGGSAIYPAYVNNTLIENIKIGPYTQYGITMYYSDNVTILNNTIDAEDTPGSWAGIYLIGSSSVHAIIRNNVVCNLDSTSVGPVGINISNYDETIINGNIIYDLNGTNSTKSLGPLGISIETSSRSTINDNVIVNLKNSSTATSCAAIYVSIGGSICKITNNYCYNNGSDTGIANTNQNNFYDAGTDTQVYSNSWQQPVAGEPTQGELKWLPQSTATLTEYLLVGVTTTAAWSSCSLGSSVPVGSKSAYMGIIVFASAAAAGLYRHQLHLSNDYSATPALGTHHITLRAQGYAGGAGEVAVSYNSIFVPLDADRKFYFYGGTRTNATACQIYAYVSGYSI